MHLELEGKRILIAGGSRGIGLAIAEAFLREGARVMLIARSPEPLKRAADRLVSEHGSDRVLAFPADCTNANAWPYIIEKIRSMWGGLDAAVANVGDGRGLHDALPDPEHFAITWRMNFSAAEHTARAAMPLLQSGSGSLLFISSIAGLEAIGAPTDYSVAKTAILALSKQLSRKLAPTVRVNCLAPGNVCFPGGSWDAKIKAEPERIRSLINATVPLRRFAQPMEIADAAVFLCSSRASFITGACLVVDGGQTVGVL